MTTGQFPKRRETDQQAKRRVEGIEARRSEQGGGYQAAQVGLLAELTRLFRSQQSRDAFR